MPLHLTVYASLLPAGLPPVIVICFGRHISLKLQSVLKHATTPLAATSQPTHIHTQLFYSFLPFVSLKLRGSVITSCAAPLKGMVMRISCCALPLAACPCAALPVHPGF